MTNGKNSFLQVVKLPNVRGRVRYISDPKRQENLYATFTNVESKYWTYLSKENQKDFRKSGTDGKCIEARELIIMLPPSLIQYDPDMLLKYFSANFVEKYDVAVASALHHNKAKTNLHIHLIFSERQELDVPERKIAERNLFYDENGKHVRTKKEILDENYKGEVVNHDVAKFVPETDYVVKVIDRHVEKAKHNLKGAPIVIAGGYGMGSKEGFDKLFELAKELHAEVGASRAAVDAGYADHDRQIGQTGVTVRPKLYIACGISGQIQHIAGMQDAGIIISVNSDPNAPINTIADYVINGTVEEVVPKLIKYYKKNSK